MRMVSPDEKLNILVLFFDYPYSLKSTLSMITNTKPQRRPNLDVNSPQKIVRLDKIGCSCLKC